MTKTETEMIIRVLEAAYPMFYRNKTSDDRRDALRLWYDMFEEDDGALVGAAVKAYIATNTSGFPPDIGQIKQRLVKLKHPDMLDEAQAWAIVSRAIQRSAYHSAEEFEKLPEVIKCVVSSPSMLKSWAMADGDDLQTVIASNFQRAYRARASEAAERLALPTDIKRLLERTDCTRRLPEPEDPEEQKRRAIALLQAERDEYAEKILGDSKEE